MGSGASNMVVLPTSNAGDWTLSRPPAAVAFLRVSAASLLSQSALRDAFSLTRSEAELALALIGGRTLRTIAETSGRSFNTVRSHLARLMEKTGTRKQVDLVRLLDDVAAFGPARSAPPARPH
jgi:DNA-binding CsgD family transcriptional regulator